MFQKDRKINGAGLFLSVVNTYRFSEKSEVIALEFSVSNIKRLLLGIYKTPIQNYFFFFLIKLILCYGNFVERHSFHTMKLCKTKVFYAVSAVLKMVHHIIKS